MLDLIREERLDDVPLLFDYSQIDATHRDALIEDTIAYKRRDQRIDDDLLANGEMILRWRQRLPHGQFSDWVRTDLKFTPRKAQMLMATWEVFNDKSETVSLLGRINAMLLAAPSVPDAARQEAEETATELRQQGKRLTKAATQAIINQHKPQPVEAVAVHAAVGKCEVCHRQLTDPDHVAQGCGPVCAARRAAVVEPEPFDDLEPTSPGVTVIGNGAIDDDDMPLSWRPPVDELTPYQRKQRRLLELLDIWWAALETLVEVGELTGFYQQEPVRRAVTPVMNALKGNLT